MPEKLIGKGWVSENFNALIHRLREQFARERIHFDDLLATDLPDRDIHLFCVHGDVLPVGLEDLLFVEDSIALLLLDADFLGQAIDELTGQSLGGLLFSDMRAADLGASGNLGLFDLLAVKVDLDAIDGIEGAPPVRIERDPAVLVYLFPGARVMNQVIGDEAEPGCSLDPGGADCSLFRELYREMGNRDTGRLRRRLLAESI